MKEKKGGSQNLITANNEFKNFIKDRGLIDMGFYGPAFTWSNGAVANTYIFERLDRAVCTPDWFFRFQDNGVLHLPRISSDHAPILVNTDRTRKKKRRHTNKFEYFWTEHPAFQDIVHEAWHSNTKETTRKIIEVGEELYKWSRKPFGNIFRKGGELKAKLLKIQMEAHSRDTREEEKKLCMEIENLNVLQRRYYEQRRKAK